MNLYHATFQAYLPSIEEKGLLPDQQKNWPGCASGFVYLASDMYGAISFCETAEDVSSDIIDSGICCFEISSDALDLALLSVDPNIIWDADEDPWCFVYAGRIPYDALHLCWSEEMEHSKLSLDQQIQSATLRTSLQSTKNSVTHERSNTYEQRLDPQRAV